jgi:hypothetical protein
MKKILLLLLLTANCITYKATIIDPIKDTDLVYCDEDIKENCYPIESYYDGGKL